MSDEMKIPRPEYPRPQFVRDNWQNLNGRWAFEIDHGNSGKDRGFFLNSHELPREITVPFCPESPLSGIGFHDFMAAVWYRRTVKLTAEQLRGRVILHFGAVDYRCEVFVNEQPAGVHIGGYSSFSLDITAFARPGENVLTVLAVDDTRSRQQPSGKQSGVYQSRNCVYTRTTGIWQTVWLEFVPACHIRGVKIMPDRLNRTVTLTVNVSGLDPELLENRPVIRATVRGQADGSAVMSGTAAAQAGPAVFSIKWPEDREIREWGPGQPNLYDLELKLESPDGACLDKAVSYFGFRTLELLGDGLYINGKPVFQRLILDQGFFPDGIYTAPSDEDLKRDIEYAMAIGFNGARLHQRVFEERYLYWADRLGYLVWGEMATWGLDISSAEGLACYLPEWVEILDRDRNHPAIIGWCPFNETNGRQDSRVLSQVYQVTKAIDPSRPVIDTSGYVHVVTDIYDVHDYDQDPATFEARYKPLAEGGPAYVNSPDDEKYEGQPYMVSEYGGTWWSPGKTDGWGYGNSPLTELEFADRYCGLTGALLRNPKICAFCYTQMTDVEQEQNGLYTYERKPKFSAEIYARIRSCNMSRAAFEK